MTSDNNNQDWLTPKEVEREYGVSLRQVYRLIERGKIDSDGAKRDIKVSRESFEIYQRGNQARAYVEQVTQVNDGQEAGNRSRGQQAQEVKSGLAMQIAAMQSERERLLEQIDNLQSSRLDYARAEAELRGRVEGLELQIERLETGSNRQGRLIGWLILALVALALVGLVAVVLLALLLK